MHLSNLTTTALSRTLLVTTLLGGIAGLVGIGGLTGCASTTAAPHIEETHESMSVTRSSINAGSAQIDDVLASLNALGGTSDLKTTFASYEEAIKLLEKDATRVRERWAKLTANADDYERHWERELEKIQGAQARAISESRRDEFRARIAELRDSFASLKDAYDPFLSQLNDVRLVLASDLTPGGVASIRPLRHRANDLARDLRERLADTRRTLAAAEAEYTTNVRSAAAEEEY